MSCGKIAYETKSDAQTDAAFIQTQAKHFNRRSKNRKQGKKLRAYQCQRCTLWHLTSEKPRRKK